MTESEKPEQDSVHIEPWGEGDLTVLKSQIEGAWSMTASGKAQSEKPDQNIVHLEAWGEGDLPFLKSLLGDPAMTRYLGGPENDKQLVERQARYERLKESGKGEMLKIIYEATGEAVGSVGYWDSTHNGEEIYEMGWSVLIAFQGRGIAGAAVAQAIERVRADGRHRSLHAFPSIHNPASNALCRKSGFTLIEECEFEFPKGSFMQCNDWRLELAT